MLLEAQEEILTEDWSNVGGCSIKHLFNKDAREDCEQLWREKQGIPQAEAKAQSDLLLAQAAMQKAAQQEQSQWTPMKTTLVVVGSMAAIGLVAFFIIRAKKRK